MKKVILFFATLLAFGQSAFAYSFSAIAPTGQTLYYNITGGQAILTYPGSSWTQPYYGFTKPSGDLEIPASVTYSGNTYEVTSIGSCALSGCIGITSVTIPNTIITIQESAFFRCDSLKSVTIPNSVTSIGGSAFSSCYGLDTVTIGHGVTIIGHAAFLGCSSLDTLTIGCSVSTIEMNAFKDCSSLDAITLYAEVPPTLEYDPHYSGGVFYNVPHDIPVYVPCVSLAAYQGWNAFSNIQCDSNIQAHFIWAESASPTRGVVSGSGYYSNGATATLTATPNTGYHFVQWQDGNTQNPRTVTVTGYAFYMATFASDVAGTATATAAISEITDTSAMFEIVMGQHTWYYYFFYGPQSEFTQNGLTTDEAIISYVNQHYSSSDREYFDNSGYFINDLSPNTTYKLVVVPYNDNGEVGTVCWEQFTTLGTTDTATVTATISEIESTSAHADIVMGQHTSYFYYFYGPQSAITQNGLTTDEAIINYVNQNYGASERNYNNVSGYMNGLTPNTAYLLVVVPYNSNDEVGTITKTQFTTPNTNGIEDANEKAYTVSSQDGYLSVGGAEGRMVSVYSIDGRCIFSSRATETTVIDVPTAGVYLVKVDDTPARRVVVR